MRDLLGLAAQGIEVPDDPVVDDIMHKADRIRRRRRIMLAAGSAAAVVAVGVGTALLPQPGVGAPRGDVAGSAPATPPGETPATSAPPPTADPTGSATSVPGNRPRTSSAAPSSSAATSPTRTATTTPPTTKPPSSTGGSATRTTGGATAAGGKSPLDFVKGKLPAGIGTVTKKADTGTPSYTRNPLSGRYLVTKNGRMGWIDITVYDPKVNPDQSRETVEQVAAHDYCADTGTAPSNTNCASNGEGEGGIFKTWRSPSGRQEAAGHVSGPVYHALLYYPDGRGLEISAAAGITGADGYLPAMDTPPITAEQLTDLIGGAGWFKT
ncbi:hypothetical protein [Streptodolium elevatio]|uniref:Uncharacterized protein n=1 Tax=Streptodolium elevatio TaxID=3157996 RepID=A0ABV3DNZ4_9ACTN